MNATPTEPLRSQLGEFNSIVCFKAAVVGVEQALGERAARVALTAAGRTRGRDLVASLGLDGSSTTLDDAARKLGAALGEDGTRLCNIHSIVEQGDEILVTVSETVCMAGEPMGSKRECSFTLGAVHGAVEALTGRKLRAKHTHSRWRGDADDIFTMTSRV